jgi:hypothetical protein
MIKSKFRLWYLIFLPFFLLLTIAVVKVSLSSIEQPADYLYYILLLPIFWVVFSMYKRATIIRLWPDRLELRSLFGKKIIYNSEISAIDLSAREYVGSWSSEYNANAVVVRKIDSERLVLIDFYYRNVPELKRGMQEYCHPEAGVAAPIAHQSRSSMPVGEEEEAERFAGSPLLGVTIGPLVILVAILITTAFIVSHGHLPTVVWLMLAAVIVALTIVGGYVCFYFKVTNKWLIVRNHFFPWYRRAYRIDEIQTVIFERLYKGGNSLRINFRDFDSKKFPARSLWARHWKALEQRLKAAQVEVQNEL